MWSWRELMVVIFIGGGLLGLGALQAERGSSQWKQTLCLSNLKTLHRAVAGYQNDWDGAFPQVVVRQKPLWSWWYNRILPYTVNPRAFYCAANPVSRKAFGENFEEGDDLIPPIFEVQSLAYGMNYSFGEANLNATPTTSVCRNAKDVSDPSYLIMLGDCKMPFPGLRPTPACWKDDYAPVHEEKSNYVFVDGHVETLNKDNLGLLNAFDGWKQDAKRWRGWKQ